MELFRSIAANTEKQLQIVISKKKVAGEDVLLVIVKQDEITPFSIKDTPKGLDDVFEQLYADACAKFKALITHVPEEPQSNIDAVVETEKKEQEEQKAPAAKSTSKSTKKEEKKADVKDPLDDIRKKIEKCNKADAKKLLDITDRVKKSKDPDVRDFSVKELERYMEKCKFTAEEIKLWTDEALKNGVPAPAAPASEAGLFAGKQTEAQMVEVTEEEEEEAPVEEEKAVEPEPEPVKEDKKEDKKQDKKADKKPAPKPEPATQPEDDDLLF